MYIRFLFFCFLLLLAPIAIVQIKFNRPSLVLTPIAHAYMLHAYAKKAYHCMTGGLPLL